MAVDTEFLLDNENFRWQVIELSDAPRAFLKKISRRMSERIKYYFEPGYFYPRGYFCHREKTCFIVPSDQRREIWR